MEDGRSWPRKHGDDCLQELRWLYDRHDLAEAKADLAAWIAKWSARHPRLVRALAVETNENWMEANRYINMDDLREHKKLALRQAG